MAQHPIRTDLAIRDTTVTNATIRVLRRIEDRGALDTAHRANQNCRQIFRYAIATGRATHNPTPDLRGALPSSKKSHYAAIIEPKATGQLLRAFEHMTKLEQDPDRVMFYFQDPFVKYAAAS